jgi:hypothetical protein
LHKAIFIQVIGKARRKILNIKKVIVVSLEKSFFIKNLLTYFIKLNLPSALKKVDDMDLGKFFEVEDGAYLVG